MCGFVGFLDLRGERPADGELLRRMTDQLVHRGPDSAGFFVEDAVGLGFRRLSIIDLATGDQPIYNEDRSVVGGRDGRSPIKNHGERDRPGL